jgi:ATP-binding cassette, subfamily B, beta-glucan exporter
MTMLRLYARVLGLLGSEKRLGWMLALANVALAATALAEPVLFGRIIDALANVQGAGGALDGPRLTPLVAAWVGFGLFLIVCGALVALYADKLAHAPWQAGQPIPLLLYELQRLGTTQRRPHPHFRPWPHRRERQFR